MQEFHGPAASTFRVLAGAFSIHGLARGRAMEWADESLLDAEQRWE
jgi:hypothetical protein